MDWELLLIFSFVLVIATIALTMAQVFHRRAALFGQHVTDGRCSKESDDRWLNELQLTLQVGHATRYLGCLGYSIVRWAAFDDVRD